MFHVLKIWAANDIKIFVRMMTQRNIELQLQALDMIERRRQASLLPASGENNEEPTTSTEVEEEAAPHSDVEDNGSGENAEAAEEDLDEVIQEDVK